MLNVESAWWASIAHVPNLNQKCSINLLLKSLVNVKSFRLCNPRNTCHCSTCQNLHLSTKPFAVVSDEKDMIPDNAPERAFSQVYSNKQASGSLLNAS